MSSTDLTTTETETVTDDDDNSIVDTVDGYLKRAEPFFPVVFGLVQISPKETIVGAFEYVAHKVKGFVKSTKNTADDTLIRHLVSGMKAAIAILES